MRFLTTVCALALMTSAAVAQDFSAAQVNAIDDFWDAVYDCSQDDASCADVGPAARDLIAAGLCPEENRIVPCDASGVTPVTERPPATPAEVATPARATTAETVFDVEKLSTINPEWHQAIARGACLTETGFEECQAHSPARLAPNGHLYDGLTVEESRLLTRWNIYGEECRGAVGQENINGWCSARDQAKDALATIGLCLYAEPINGFRSCAPADSRPETVPFDDSIARAAFEALPVGQRQAIQALTSAGGADGGYGPRTADALRRTARLLEDLTARDPQPYDFDLSTADGARHYISVLREPLTEAIIMGGH